MVLREDCKNREKSEANLEADTHSPARETD